MFTDGRSDRQGRRSYNISSLTNLLLFVSDELPSHHVKSGFYRPASETPSGWRFADGPIVARGFADGPKLARDRMLAGLTWLKNRIKEREKRKKNILVSLEVKEPSYCIILLLLLSSYKVRTIHVHEPAHEILVLSCQPRVTLTSCFAGLQSYQGLIIDRSLVC